MCGVVVFSLLLGICTAMPSVQDVQSTAVHEAAHEAVVVVPDQIDAVAGLGQDDPDLVLTQQTSRKFPLDLENIDLQEYYDLNSEYGLSDQSEAKFFALTKDFADLPILKADLALPLSSKTSAVISLNDSVTSTLSTIGNIGLLLGGIYLIGNSIGGGAASNARSDTAGPWNKLVAGRQQPPKFQNVLEKSSLSQFNRKMGISYSKPKPGRKMHAKKPTGGMKNKLRPSKSKFIRKSNEKEQDRQIDRQFSSGQNERQLNRPTFNPNLRPRVPTIPTLRLRMPTVSLPSLRLRRPNLSNLGQNLRNMVPTLRPVNLPRPARPLAPLRRPPPAQQPARRPAPPAPEVASIRPAPPASSTSAVIPPLPSTSIRPEPVLEDSTFRNQANPILPEPIEFNSIFNSNQDPFAEFRDEDFGDAASFRELLDSQFGDFDFKRIKRKDN